MISGLKGRLRCSSRRVGGTLGAYRRYAGYYRRDQDQEKPIIIWRTSFSTLRRLIAPCVKTTFEVRWMKILFTILILALFQCGCASIISLKTTPQAAFRPDDQAYARQVYGGARTDWHEARGWIPGPSWAWPIGIVIFLDLPFSAALDTVALPFTIPYNLMKSNKETSNHSSEATPKPGAPQ